MMLNLLFYTHNKEMVIDHHVMNLYEILTKFRGERAFDIYIGKRSIYIFDDRKYIGMRMRRMYDE